MVKTESSVLLSYISKKMNSTCVCVCMCSVLFTPLSYNDHVFTAPLTIKYDCDREFNFL